MNNDLINRSELKKAIGDLYGLPFEEMVEDFTWLKAIDNAPTMAVNCKDCDGYEARYSARLKDAERPHGKWIKIFENPFTNGYVCPFCNHRIQVTEKFLSEVTVCESCGADMR